jgi:hypothetical protein
MITLKESLLSKTDGKVSGAKKTLHVLSRLPDKKDWKKITPMTHACRWDLTWLREEYEAQYSILKDYDYIMFYWQGKSSGVVSTFLGNHSHNRVLQRAVHYQCGWNSKITDIKNDINKFLTLIIENPKEMDDFLFALENDQAYDIYDKI